MSDSSETTELSGSVESTTSIESTSTSNTDSTSPGDDIHHDIPHRSVRDKLCDFYMSAKGCIKGDACDFHHPRAPNGAITNRVCEYYLQPRGCVKGDDCDFLHPQQRLRQGIRGGIATGYKSTRPCEFFFSNRGCVKGDDCDYSHINMAYMNGPNPYYRGPPMRYPPGPYPPRYPYMGMGMPMMPHAPHGHIPPHIAMGMPPQRPQPCSFFNTEKGCIKGVHCDFIHQKNKACDFFHSERGCRKGKYCDYLHTFDGQPTHIHNSITRPIPVTGYYNPYIHDIQTSPITTTSTEHAQAHSGNNQSQAVAVEAAS